MYSAKLQLAGANVTITTYLWRRGRFSETEVLMKGVVKNYETKFGCEPPTHSCHEPSLLFICCRAGTLWSINNFACVYDLQGRYDDAEALYNRILGHGEKHLGANHRTCSHS
jgi:hypothetical protein